MSQSDTLSSATQPALKLKGSLFPLTVLQILETDSAKIAHQWQQLVRTQKSFFQNIPLILDLHLLAERAEQLDWDALLGLIRNDHIFPVGVRTTSERMRIKAIASGLAVFSEGKDQEIAPVTPSSTNKTTPPAVKSSTKIVTVPVRSGQQIYAKDCDLVVLAPVSPGAELMADGHIHVYGVLRGRALAGMHGDTEARIFCRKLDAELVAIAGIYKVRDDLSAYLQQTETLQVFLNQQQHMIIEPLS